eukprot:CAMPEP_0197733864 /NCGR_PEP_ID=MMETSP1434-20131217/44125_1 /TAXON_ID=265543 /ORGANISM="Minutocellus polymorphus, Strain CCMP3303" /LENGTH=350 /DNA_ID=CAMNT_0043321259 /DNA_START=107 /DNA_END=1159 /DNA_ORIENTATION=-
MFGDGEIDDTEETTRKPFGLTGRFAAARGQMLRGLSREVSGGEAEANSDEQVNPLCGVKETYYKARDEAILMRASGRDPFANMDADGRAKLMKSISDDQSSSLRNIDQRRRRDSLASLFSIEKQMKNHNLMSSSPSSPNRAAAPSRSSDSPDGGTGKSASFVSTTRNRASIIHSRLSSIDESKQDAKTDCTVRSKGSRRSAGSVGDSFAVTSLILDPSKRLSIPAAPSRSSDSPDGGTGKSASFVSTTRNRASILRSQLASIDESKQDANSNCTVRLRGSSRSTGSVGSSFAVTSLILDPSKRLSILSELGDSDMSPDSIGDWGFASSLSNSSRNIMGDDMLNYSTNKKL